VLRHELEARPQEKHSRRGKEDSSSRVTDVVLVMRGE